MLAPARCTANAGGTGTGIGVGTRRGTALRTTALRTAALRRAALRIATLRAGFAASFTRLAGWLLAARGFATPRLARGFATRDFAALRCLLLFFFARRFPAARATRIPIRSVGPAEADSV